jgi:SMC interacting uncharacterized protein involved in chromosome segregation
MIYPGGIPRALMPTVKHLLGLLVLQAEREARDSGEGLSRALREQLNLIRTEMQKMSAELDRLTREVAENGTVIQSAIVLLEGLAERIRELATDPAALTALADELDAKEQQLAAAITANTPEPTPEPE